MVVGLFDTFSSAEMALREIENLGISHNDVSIVANNADNEYSSWRANAGSDYGTPPAGVGANTGAVVGGIGGVLLGLGLLVIPGLGPLAAAGPLVAGLTGAGVGAVAGGLIGALMDIGIPEEEAGYYAEGVRRGGTLVSVNAPDNQVSQVVTVLNRNGAVDIDQRRAYYQQTGYTGYNQNAPAYTAAELQAERERLRANNMLYTNTSTGHVSRDLGGLDGTRSGVEGNIPGIQTGGRAIDGSGMPDTRGVLEKTADALTGDRIDDKTGRPV
jgi:hypothetical protein